MLIGASTVKRDETESVFNFSPFLQFSWIVFCCWLLFCGFSQKYFLCVCEWVCLLAFLSVFFCLFILCTACVSVCGTLWRCCRWLFIFLQLFPLFPNGSDGRWRWNSLPIFFRHLFLCFSKERKITIFFSQLKFFSSRKKEKREKFEVCYRILLNHLNKVLLATYNTYAGPLLTYRTYTPTLNTARIVQRKPAVRYIQRGH